MSLPRTAREDVALFLPGAPTQTHGGHELPGTVAQPVWFPHFPGVPRRSLAAGGSLFFLQLPVPRSFQPQISGSSLEGQMFASHPRVIDSRLSEPRLWMINI